MNLKHCGGWVVWLLLLFSANVMLRCCDAWTISVISPRSMIASSSTHRHKTTIPPLRKNVHVPIITPRRNHHQKNNIYMIGTGFSFEDGEQILVSVQKPFGIVLEQGGGDGGTSNNSEEGDSVDDGRIVVVEVDPNGSAGKAGVREGDVLVAVQNVSTISADLGEVLDFIATKCPRVVNLRFQRME